MTLLDRVRALQRAQEYEAEALYRIAVREAADGKDLDPSAVLKAIAESGHSVEDFARDVLRAEGKRVLKAVLITGCPVCAAAHFRECAKRFAQVRTAD